MKLGLVLLVGIGLIGAGVGYRQYEQHQVAVAQQKEQAAVKQVKQLKAAEKAKRLADKKKQLAEKIKADPFSKTESTNEQITSMLEADNFVGTALVVKDKKVIYQKGFGYANYDKKLKNGPRSKYQILSIQKSLTAAGIMQLVQAGKVKLSDKLSKYYPSITHCDDITIRMMLDMSSGLQLKKAPEEALPENQVVNFAVTNATYDAKKHGVFNYSSINFLLLAGIIRQQSGISYQNYFEKNIIKKLDLHDTGFVIDGYGKNGTIGYQATKTQVNADYTPVASEPESQMTYELGTGQVYMSAGDLFKAESAILEGRLMSASNVEILHTRTATSPYAGGLYRVDAGTLRSHGMGYGQESAMMLSNDGQSGVILLSNYWRPAVNIQTPMAKIYEEMMLGNLN